MNWKIWLTVIFATFLLGACNKATEPEPVPGGGGFIPDSLSYLALGDSYTKGEGVSPNERFPSQLTQKLIENEFPLKVPTVFAETGWTTGDLILNIEAKNFGTRNFGLVTLLIGVNNQFQGRPIEEYEDEFETLLQRAIEFAKNKPERVFVISIPDYAYTPYGKGNPDISEEIDAFNDVNERIAGKYAVQYFNITPISRNGLDQPELVASDGLHPSGMQYEQWVDFMLPKIQRALTE